jgi:hypothetical protein
VAQEQECSPTLTITAIVPAAMAIPVVSFGMSSIAAAVIIRLHRQAIIVQVQQQTILLPVQAAAVLPVLHHPEVAAALL